MKKSLLLSCVLLSSFILRAADSDAGPYVKLRAGGSVLHDVDLKLPGVRGAEISFDPGSRVDFAVGYAFNPTCSIELETGVIANSVDDVSAAGIPFRVAMDLYQVPIMVNGIYKLAVDCPVRPYFGAGVGGAASILDGTISLGGTRASGSETDWTFAYQVFAGLGYQVTSSLDVGLVYKFGGTTDHDWDGLKTDGILSHSLLAAVRFRF